MLTLRFLISKMKRLNQVIAEVLSGPRLVFMFLPGNLGDATRLENSLSGFAQLQLKCVQNVDFFLFVYLDTSINI